MRKLASIQKILDIKPIENADSIECAIINGWTVVVKKNEFTIGDKCVFFEIDSILPVIEQFRFLGDPRVEYNGYRLKTIKLRGQLSQGLALPIVEFNIDNDIPIDTDLTEQLHIKKYEPPMPEEDGAKPSNRIWEISKTDEDRYQSNTKLVKDLQGCEYYATIKLDGTSMTMITNIDDNDNPEVNVCGRNSCYIEDPNNKYWKIANQYNIKEQMLDYYRTNNIRIAFQGELIGPKIQGNKMGMDENDVYIFNVFEARGKQPFEKCDYETSKYYTKKFGLKFVPIKLEGIFAYEKEELQSLTNDKYIEYFPNANPEQLIEGLVFRSKDMKISFKVVSNEFLLRGGE